MTASLNLIVLTPLAAGFIARYLVHARLGKELLEDTSNKIKGPQSFCYPIAYVDVIFVFGIVVPLIIYFLPYSFVLDARYLFDAFAIASSLLLFYSWAYLRYYKIVVTEDSIIYRAFWKKRLRLSDVTCIKYHWVNNGIYLKLFSGKKVLVNFEGGVAHFDSFAKCVRSKLPDTVRVETVGKAAFS